jgi:arginine utilization regulatory protein
MHGLFRQAGRGTIYLDEINSMPTGLQAKLLRVIQEKNYRSLGGREDLPLQCKIISSINKDPLACVKDGSLREDLYYRLSAITLLVPALKDRLEDLDPLADYLISKYKEIYGKADLLFSGDAKLALKDYTWPGNVRELEHVIEQSISMASENGDISLYNLPPYLVKQLNRPHYDWKGNGVQGNGSLHTDLLAAERFLITEALKQNQNNITKSASALGIHRQNLQYRIKKLNIQLNGKKT